MTDARRTAAERRDSGPARFSDAASRLVRVWLLGRFEVSADSRTIGEDGWRLRKAASLVKLLALAPGHRLHREQILDLLWPDLKPRSAANNLYQTLHVARRTLEPEAATSRYLRLHDDRLALCPDDQLWTDVEAFEAAAKEARRARSPVSYREALDLYAGDLLPRDRYEDSRSRAVRRASTAGMIAASPIRPVRRRYATRTAPATP